MQVLQNQQEQQNYLKSYWAIFKRRGWMIFLILALTVATAALYLVRAQEEYEATAVVKIAITMGGGDDKLAAISALLGGSSGGPATEIEIIKGRELAGRIVANLGMAKKEEVSELEWRQIVSKLQRGLDVKQRGGTNLIEIKAISDSPQKAQNIANETANVYIEISNDTKQKAWKDLTMLLETELERVKNDLERSRQRLYSSAMQDGVATAFLSLLGGNQREVSAEALQAIGSLKTNIMSMEVQLNSLMKKGFSEMNPAVIDLKNRISASKERLQQEDKEVKEKYNKQFGLTSVAAEVAFNQQLYGILMSKHQELKAQYIMQNKSPEIVEEALRPFSSSRPDKKIVLVASSFLGVFVGLGLIMVLEYVDSSMHTAGDVVRAIGLPVLGRIPRLKRIESNPGSNVLITYNDVSSFRRAWVREFYKESYRMLQLGVMVTAHIRRGLTLLVDCLISNLTN